jgi:hypothetical protein
MVAISLAAVMAGVNFWWNLYLRETVEVLREEVLKLKSFRRADVIMGLRERAARHQEELMRLKLEGWAVPNSAMVGDVGLTPCVSVTETPHCMNPGGYAIRLVGHVRSARCVTR